MGTALDILSTVLSICEFFFLNAAVILFLKCFYDPGFQWNRKKAGLLLLYFLVEILLQLALGEWLLDDVGLLVVTAYELLVGLFLVIYDYTGNKLKGIFRYGWVYIVVTLCTELVREIGSQFVFSGYSFENMNITHTQFIVSLALCAGFFVFVFLYLYYRVYKQGLFLPWRKREKLFVLIYSVLCVVVNLVIWETGKTSDTAMMILGITFILFAILLPVSIYGLRISEHFEQRTKMQEVYLQSELEHFRRYMHAQEETRRFRHDIRNNLLCLQDMVAGGNYGKAEQYLRDLLELTDTFSPRYASGDELLDSIVNTKAQVMQQKGISFELDGRLIGGLSWKPMDICAVFANALDNAIEACEKVAPEKRRILMEIKSTPQFWLIRIENTVAERVEIGRIFQKNGGYTTKSNAAAHGIGTYSMKQTVEAYGDMLEAECDDETFRLEVLIDKQKNN